MIHPKLFYFLDHDILLISSLHKTGCFDSTYFPAPILSKMKVAHIVCLLIEASWLSWVRWGDSACVDCGRRRVSRRRRGGEAGKLKPRSPTEPGRGHGCRHWGGREEELAGQDGRGKGVPAVVGHPRGLPPQHPHTHRSGKISTYMSRFSWCQKVFQYKTQLRGKARQRALDIWPFGRVVV